MSASRLGGCLFMEGKAELSRTPKVGTADTIETARVRHLLGLAARHLREALLQ